MQHVKLNEIVSREVIPGFHGKFVHSKKITSAYWDIMAGYAIPDHTHKQEQIMNLIEGEFELDINGEHLQLYAGAVVVIPSNMHHSGKAITHCKVIDIFTPVREDFIFDCI